MDESTQAVRELSQGERALEAAYRVLVAHASGLPIERLIRFGDQHGRAADWLDGLIGGDTPGSPHALMWSARPAWPAWVDRASALSAGLRGALAIVTFLSQREQELLERYCRKLPLIAGGRRGEIQERLMPDAMARLAVLDRLGQMAGESCLVE